MKSEQSYSNILSQIVSECNCAIQEDKNPNPNLLKKGYKFEEVSSEEANKILDGKYNSNYDGVVGVYKQELDDDNILIMIHKSNDNDRTNSVRADSHLLEFMICDNKYNSINSMNTNTFYL